MNVRILKVSTDELVGATIQTGKTIKLPSIHSGWRFNFDKHSIAPHNKESPKRYECVAGCLIAYAFKQSLIQGNGDYKGQLFFDVMEESEEASQKLINLYRKKYAALYMGNSRPLKIITCVSKIKLY